MRIRSVDLNLLPQLRALLEERSVSRAAERLTMSQPAMSAALSRLRRHFGDELLVRRGNRYELSPLAAQLLDRMPHAMRSVEQIFAAEAEFASSVSTREFRIVASDYAMAVLGGPLATIARERAPGVRFTFTPPTRDVVNNPHESLRGDDGMLLPHGLLTDFPHMDLFVDRWVCVVDATVSDVGDELTLDDLRRLPWVASYNGPTESTPASKQLQLLGVSPKVVANIYGFLAIPPLIAGTPRIALMQERVARMSAPSFGLRVLEPPVDLLPFREAFWWHPIHDRTPEHLWLRALLPDVVAHAGLDTAHGDDPDIVD